MKDIATRFGLDEENTNHLLDNVLTVRAHNSEHQTDILTLLPGTRVLNSAVSDSFIRDFC